MNLNDLEGRNDDRRALSLWYKATQLAEERCNGDTPFTMSAAAHNDSTVAGEAFSQVMSWEGLAAL